MKKILTVTSTFLLFACFAVSGGAQSKINTNLDSLNNKEAKVKMMNSKVKFNRFDNSELNLFLDKNFQFAKQRSLLNPFTQFISEISQNNFLFGNDDYSRKLISAFQKIMPSVPDLINGIDENMSSLDILLQIAKNLSHEKTLQDSGMSPVEDTNPHLAAYAPVFEAVKRAEGKSERKIQNTESVLKEENLSPNQIKNLLQ